MAIIASLAISITARTKKFEKAMTRIEKRVKRTARNVGALSKQFARFGIAIGVVATGIGVVAIRAFGSFEKSMNRVRALSGATGQAFEALKDTAKELGKTTVFTASESAVAMGLLAQAGLDVKEIMTAIPGVLNLAASAQVELGEAADIAVGVLKGFGFEVEQLGRVNDVLIKTMISTKTTVDDLSEGLAASSAVASSLGFNFEEVAAALGLMIERNIRGEKAGTGLRNIMLNLAAPTDAAARQLKELGINAKDSAGNLLPLVDIVEQFEKAEVKADKATKILGKRAGPLLAVLISSGSDSLRRFTKELKEAGGTAERIAKIQLEGFSGQMTKLKSAVEGVKIELGEGLAPVLTEVAKLMTDFTATVNLQNVGKNTIEFLVLGFAKVGDVLIGVTAVFEAFVGRAKIGVANLLKPIEFLVKKFEDVQLILGQDVDFTRGEGADKFIKDLEAEGERRLDLSRDLFEKSFAGTISEAAREFLAEINKAKVFTEGAGEIKKALESGVPTRGPGVPEEMKIPEGTGQEIDLARTFIGGLGTGRSIEQKQLNEAEKGNEKLDKLVALFKKGTAATVAIAG